jgi:hypothetical protein
VSVRCPGCGREFDVTLFEYGNEVLCPCGRKVTLESGHTVERLSDLPDREAGMSGIDWESLEREIFAGADAKERERDRGRAEEFRRAADRIASLILYGDMPRIDIEIQIRELRRTVLAVFPDKGELFDALYVGRFRRLWEQFRDSDEELCAD